MAVKRRIALVAAFLVALAAIGSSLPVDPLARLEVRGEVRSGSWWFPRGGPYILGFEAPGRAELRVDGEVVAVGAGEITRRVIYEAGAHAVTFRGPQGTRLLWHPPGRRGALEYVPPSSMSSEPPSTARFGRFAGAWLPQAVVATLFVLVLLAFALVTLRPRMDRGTVMVLAVLGVALAVRLADLSGAGQTWDEDEYWSAGRNYLVNLLALDFRAASWRWNFQHPPVTKYLAGLGALWADGYGPARAVFAAVGAAQCALVAAIGRRLFGARAGLFAGLAAALSPRLIGYDKIVGHEAPSVLAWTLAVYVALRLADDERPRTARAAWLGLVVGLAAAVRFANLLVVPLVAAVVLWRARREQRGRTVVLGFLAALVALATCVVVWPRMWTSPVVHLHAAWEVLRQQHLPEVYLGRVVQSPAWHYFPVYFLATAPLGLLICALGLGTWRAVARREPGIVEVLLWLVVPFGVAASPVRQDGVRYVLPALAPLALLGGAGLDHLASVVNRRWAGRTLGVLLGGYMVLACLSVRPYCIDYFGEQVGGTKQAASRRWFEVGGWGEGIGAAVAFVNANAAPGATVYRLLQPTHLNWLRADLWRDTSLSAADWVLVNDLGLSARGLDETPSDIVASHDLVFTAQAQGAPLVRVYRRRPE